MPPPRRSSTRVPNWVRATTIHAGRAIFIAAVSFGDNTVQLALKGGGAIGSAPLPVYDQFSFGGFLRLSGYRTGQFYGESLAFGRLVYYRKLSKAVLTEGVYAGASLEAGRIGGPLVPGSPTGMLTSGALILAADTPLGPVYLGYGIAGERQQNLLLLSRQALMLTDH